MNVQTKEYFSVLVEQHLMKTPRQRLESIRTRNDIGP